MVTGRVTNTLRLRVVNKTIGRGGGAKLGVEADFGIGVKTLHDRLLVGPLIPPSTVVAPLLPVVETKVRLDGGRRDQVIDVIRRDLPERTGGPLNHWDSWDKLSRRTQK